MSAGTWNVTAEQGVTWNPTLTHRDSAAALVNLTGYTARMQVRETYAGAAVLDLTTENGGITLGGAAGTIALLATASQMAALSVPNNGNSTPPTRIFYYDLELVNGAVVTRLLQGKFTVSRGVTR